MLAKTVLKTEDTGKIFEMAICLALNIPFNGHYKYSIADAQHLQTRLGNLHLLLPPLLHTANKGARYDYTGTLDTNIHLSAKTTKKGGGKVAPQVLGQGQPTKFCHLLGITFIDTLTLKQYIQDEILTILPLMIHYTFDCPNIFYNQTKNTIQFITFITPIDWTLYSFSWTRHWNSWANSSTLKILIDGRYLPFAEFQFHSKHRTNMAIRWHYSTLLSIFHIHFNIIEM